MKPPPNSLVDAPEARLVVSGNEQLELRRVLEEVAAHEPGGDDVAAGECFDLRLRPAPAFFSLDDGRHQAGTAEPATSVGCRSPVDAVKVSIGATLA